MNKKFKFITIFFFFSLFILALNIDVKSEMLPGPVECESETWCMPNCGRHDTINDGTACCKSGVSPRGHAYSAG